ncbi:hypothetical protein [Sinomonas sp. P47F7]|uniref:hypothetical protein n=1 Tax=Sinomonas sp. P47F7 TaxID=3410987 RepID=UPI003BF61956
MTEQPPEREPVDVFDLGTGRNPEADAVLLTFPEVISEQQWLGNDTPQGRDLAYAAAFDDASDTYDAVGDALENGNLATAHQNAERLVRQIARMQTLETKEALG